MARTSRRDRQLQQTGRPVNVTPGSIKAVNRTGIYARLSLVDEARHINVESIETQILLLKSYVAERSDLYLTAEYTDRGWTGTNFQRPGFLQMIEDIQAGNINCIVVKDLSRFGRNYWETGYFLEVLLPQLKVRFISIADGFDSESSEPGALAVILKNIMNDFYARDISRRICSSYDLRKAKGVFRKRPPYGYTYDPDHPKRLTFDRETAYYVRTLFRWALEKVPLATIARNLENMKAPLPAPSGTGYIRQEEKGRLRWNHEHVKRFLTNRTYAGDFVCGKSYNRIYDPGNVRLKIPEEEWVIIPDSHPAYISHEEYGQLREWLEENARQHWSGFQRTAKEREQNPNLYRGKVTCAVCGRNMTGCISRHFKQTDKLKYVCSNPGTATHEAHLTSIRKAMLDVIVLTQLQEQIQLAGQLLAWLRSAGGKQRTQLRIRKAQETLNQAQAKKDQLEAERFTLFENYTENILSEDIYTVEMERFRDRLRQASEQTEAAARSLSTIRKALSPDNPWLMLFASIPCPDEMTEEIVQQTIARILVRSLTDAEITFLHQEYGTLLWEVCQETGGNPGQNPDTDNERKEDKK